MSASTKLSTAVKALCFLTNAHPVPKTSVEIANHISVNASKLRKILSLLVKSGIVESTYGTSGGFLIKKNPDKIHLQEIYCALEDRKAFYMDVTKTSGEVANETVRLNNFFLDLFADVQIDIENKMRNITLQSVIEKTS